jgi:DNA-binding transcriptional regulator YiaG
MKPATTKKVPFQVQIPNLDGDGIAERVPIEVEVYADPETGEDVLTLESLALVERTQARHMGLMSPEEINELRRRLAVTQQEISKLLQVGEKTYTRWENGRSRPSRSMNLLLCALRDGCISVNYLRLRRDPNLKEFWFARIPDPKDAFRTLAHCTFKGSEDFTFAQAGNSQQWFARTGAVLGARSAKSANWQHIFLHPLGGKLPWMGVTLKATQSRSGHAILPATDLGRQTRTSQPIRLESDEEQFG